MVVRKYSTNRFSFLALKCASIFDVVDHLFSLSRIFHQHTRAMFFFSTSMTRLIAPIFIYVSLKKIHSSEKDIDWTVFTSQKWSFHYDGVLPKTVNSLKIIDDVSIVIFTFLSQSFLLVVRHEAIQKKISEQLSVVVCISWFAGTIKDKVFCFSSINCLKIALSLTTR
jgi:hypothetical protein